MHRATVLYDINGTVTEIKLEAPWISHQTFSSGRAVISLKDEKEGNVGGTIEIKKYYIIRIDRDAK